MDDMVLTSPGEDVARPSPAKPARPSKRKQAGAAAGGRPAKAGKVPGAVGRPPGPKAAAKAAKAAAAKASGRGAAAAKAGAADAFDTAGLFAKELPPMMYGFGDAKEPYEETVRVVEGMVVDYIRSMAQRALQHAGSSKIHVNDLKYLLRKDPQKLARVEELLVLKEVIKEAKKAIKQDDANNVAAAATLEDGGDDNDRDNADDDA